MQPEDAHHFTFRMIAQLHQIPGMGKLIHALYDTSKKEDEVEVFGLKFKNRVGLAAGLDKDARLYKELHNLGFGFIEIGTVTPLAQPGNDKPRLFRLIPDEAIINRMGFNNEGVQAAVNRLKSKSKNIIVGGNIGKNKLTPNEEAFEDYKKCFEALFDVVDYFVVNVSSPNTPGLRALQEKEPLMHMMQQLQSINQAKQKPKPLLLKIAPDLSHEQLDDIVEIAFQAQLDGIIATNTTIDREGLTTPIKDVEAIGAGGLSGKPLTQKSTEVVRYLAQKLNGRIPIIAVGGIMSGKDAADKIAAGATLVQLYTGFIYQGPALIQDCIKAIRSLKP